MKELWQRSPLKYPGAKYRVMPYINKFLPEGDIPLFIDCFVGGGSVFLNVKAKKTIICDINPHIVNFYKQLQYSGKTFIRDAKRFFTDANNTSERYYALREKFNDGDDDYQSALILLYLSRHSFNGIFRVNKKNMHNVPFGLYKQPKFPELELIAMIERLLTVDVYLSDFQNTYKMIDNLGIEGAVAYNDPPYIKLSDTANFTSYSKEGFSISDQEKLVTCMEDSSKKNVTSLVSNHYNLLSESLYKKATDSQIFNVSRTISQNPKSRKPVQEILAKYSVS